MQKKQMDALTVVKTEYGGYVVFEAGLDNKPIFSSQDLEECFSFMKELITYDSKNHSQTRMLFE
jgi:hypothetical protein